MRTRMAWVVGLVSLLAFGASRVRADGPHWHVPNPDEEYVSEEDKDKKGGLPAAGPAGQAGGKQVAGDYMRNPGNFFLMDAKCVDYYERHCVIKHGGAGKDQAFYLLIMNRCAQAMREVDTYLPCPDSFPLWHTEELRQYMLEFAKRTWIRSTQLNKADAEACAEFIVQCYVDTVRFGDESRAGRLGAKVQEFFKGNKELQEMLKKMDTEKDNAKKQAIQQEWVQKGRDGLMKSGLDKDLAKSFVTFKLITGDIPMQVDETEMRMVDALVGMGTIVLPYLQKHMQNDKNPKVQQACSLVINSLQKKFQRPTLLAATFATVLDQLRWIAQKPNTAEANAAIQCLKNMGNAALPFMLDIAENENLNLKQITLNALNAITSKGFGNDLAKWKAYVASVAPAPEKPAPAAEKPKE